MTKKDIVRSISEDLGVSQLEAKATVEKVFKAILNALVEEGRVELRNFGVFEVKRRAPRKARNPKTGERLLVPAKSVVTFKPGRVVKDRIKELGNDRSDGDEMADSP